MHLTPFLILTLSFLTLSSALGHTYTEPVHSFPLARRAEPSNPTLSTISSELGRLQARYARGFRNYQINTGLVHPRANLSILSEVLGTSAASNVLGSSASAVDALAPDQSSKRMVRTPHPAARSTNAHVAMTDFRNGALWITQMGLGTPPQTLRLDVDTGSSDLIIASRVYAPTKSSSSKSTKNTFSTSYADGTAGNGDIFFDTLSVGGLSAVNQAVGITDSRNFTQANGVDGIAGVGMPSLSALNSDSWVDTLKKTGAIQNNVLGFLFSKKAGLMDIGGVPSQYSAKMKYTPYSDDGYFSVQGTLNGHPVNGALDTGATVISGPDVEVAPICNAAGGTWKPADFGETKFGVCQYDKSKPLKLVLKFGDIEITMDPSTVYAGDGDDGKAIAAIIGFSYSGFDGWSFGDALMQNAYTVFDKDNTRVGMSIVEPS